MMQIKLPILHETLLSYHIKERDILAIHDDAHASLVNYLSKENFTKTAQPNLIIGESGSGKTFLIKRLYAKIKKDNTLYPIVIEGKSLFFSDDIWNQCASYLEIHNKKNAFDALMEWQESNMKRIVLFVDNIQYYFKRTDNTEQYGLRGKLNRNGAPILIASSEKVLPEFTEYDAAFFDGFKMTYLKPLTISDIETITNGEYDRNRLESIMSYLPKTIRSMFIAIGILRISDSSAKDIVFLSDYFFSHYQEKFDAISMQMQRILSALSQTDIGITLPEIREKTGQENGKISPYLKLMADQKLIIKKAKSLRGGVYSIIDPLFKLWLRHNVAPMSKIEDKERYFSTH